MLAGKRKEDEGWRMEDGGWRMKDEGFRGRLLGTSYSSLLLSYCLVYMHCGRIVAASPSFVVGWSQRAVENVSRPSIQYEPRPGNVGSSR